MERREFNETQLGKYYLPPEHGRDEWKNFTTQRCVMIGSTRNGSLIDVLDIQKPGSRYFIIRTMNMTIQ